MNPAFLLAAQQIADYAQRQRQAREERQRAAQGILASSARSLGAPTYNVTAAQADERANKLTEPDKLAMFQSYMQQQQKVDTQGAQRQAAAQQAQAAGKPPPEYDDEEDSALESVLMNPTYRR